jgi:plasmid stability protein
LTLSLLLSGEGELATLTVRNLDQDVYEELRALAAERNDSMEAQARDILREGVNRRRQWAGATLADLSGGPELAAIKTPYVRADDPPRDAPL